MARCVNARWADATTPCAQLTFSDINMLVNTGGRERTEAEYRALLDAAGLRVDAVRETPSFFRVFEAARA